MEDPQILGAPVSPVDRYLHFPCVCICLCKHYVTIYVKYVMSVRMPACMYLTDPIGSVV